MALSETAKTAVEDIAKEQIKEYFDSRLISNVNPNKMFGSGGLDTKSFDKAHKFDTYDKYDDGGFDNFSDFLKCVKEKNYSKLEAVETKDIEAGQAPGSFLIPQKYVADVVKGLEEKMIVMPLAKNYKIKRGQGESVLVPCIESYDYSSSTPVAGIDVYFTAEGATISEVTPTIRQLSLKLNKVSAVCDVTEELLFSSAVNTGDLINEIFSEALSFKLDSVFLTSAGTGSGLPLSIVSGGDIISVSGESGQDSDTLIALNVANMLKRLMPSAWNDSVWVCSVSNIPQLLQAGFAKGTSYMPLKVFNEVSGKYYLLGRPVLFSQHTGSLGDANSIMLCNFKKYAILTRDTMMIRVDTSAGFKQDIVSYKLTYYVDAQSVNSKTTTLADGVNTVSNFVSIASI